MAEGRSSEVLCRYFMHGACRDGNECRFSHDRERGQVDSVCRYYLRGCCIYGESCRYDHIKPQSSNNGKQIINNAGSGNVLTWGPSASSSKLTQPVKETAKSPGKPFVVNHSNLIREGCMTVLNKKKSVPGMPSKNGIDLHPSKWVDAPEFVPTTSLKLSKSYADAVLPELDKLYIKEEKSQVKELCPYAAVNDQCPFGDKCDYLHGNLCDLCGYPCLHPFDEKQRKAHVQECVKEHERDMELSFAVARSKDKTCGICMDIILDKLPPSERRFGILPNCCHVYCLSCIRKWRKAKQFENKLIRSCPECRVASDFITPSKFWVENKDDKDKLITDYQRAMSVKPCKYFRQGKGECPFGGNCFYLHAYPNGQKAELPPPQPRKRHNANGDVDLVESVVLWDLFEERYSHWLLQLQLDETFDLFSDSEDDSDWSDYDLQD